MPVSGRVTDIVHRARQGQAEQAVVLEQILSYGLIGKLPGNSPGASGGPVGC